MKIKRQKNFYDCGATVVSMLTGLTVSQCRERLGTLKGYGCFMSDIERVLRGAGFRLNKSNQITPRCIVRVELETQSHFILIWDRITYDPAKGKSNIIPSNIKEVLEIC